MDKRAAAFLVVVLGSIADPAWLRAQDASDLAGRWTLNRETSQFPREIGFSADWMLAAQSGGDSAAGGGRGRRGGSGGGATSGAFPIRRESEDDSKRVQQLTAEVRNPSTHLTVVDTPAAVTITDDKGQSRTFHPNGRPDVVQLEGVSAGVSAKREAGRLVVVYTVEQGREIRYTYSRSASPPQLIVDAQFVERGGGDKVRRVYDVTSASETAAAATAAASPAAPTPVGAMQPIGAVQPDAELKGLSRLGVVVEELSPQAAACGLKQGTLETAASKRLSDAGLTVRRNSDEDTYVYVSVITTSPSPGFCVSRYDAFLYTHTTATLSYQKAPVLVQVSLLHQGGIAGGASAAHADAVLKNVQEYVDQFAARIRGANKP